MTARAIQHQASLGTRCVLVCVLPKQALVFDDTPLQILSALNNCFSNRHLRLLRLLLGLGRPNINAKKVAQITIAASGDSVSPANLLRT